MRMRSRRLAALGAAVGLGVVLMVPATAWGLGSRVHVGGSPATLTVAEEVASVNVVSVSYDAGASQYVVSDESGLIAGAGCSAVNATTARCGADGIATVSVITKTGGDEVDACCTIPVGVKVVLRGAGGNDFLDASDGKGYLNGGPGRDQLFGEGGEDHLVGGTGVDDLYGMDGVDFLEAKDQTADHVIDCGTGFDRDPTYDVVLDPTPVSC